MKNFLQDLTVTAFGVVTSILTAVLLFLIEQIFGVSLYTWTFWFVIPIGALLAGFVAAGGYYLGARLFNHRPTSLILLNMIAISVGTFFLIHWLGYAFMEIDGKPVSDSVSFGTYLDLLLQHESLQFRFRGVKTGSTGELGAWGYVHALLQIGGFAGGGLAAFGYLSSLPYCERCSRYLSRKAQQTRFATDADAFASMVQQLATAFDAGQLQEAIDQHADSANSPKNGHLKSVLELWQCKQCGINWLKFSCHKKSRDSWEKISDLSFAGFHEGILLM